MHETYFESFRNNIIGKDLSFPTPFGMQQLHYADWTASGRLYGPIEKQISEIIGQFVANTHTETNLTGCAMTLAYKKARDIIKKHVNAGEKDILISSNAGMTGVVNKLQRIIGVKLHEKYRDFVNIPEEERPIVFITHMEHHSNQTTWLETTCQVEIIGATPEGLVDLQDFARLCEKYKNRPLKIAAVTSCSNVTGVFTPYHQIAKIIHKVGGYCFVDFACSAPYINIDMHPADKEERLDAIYFSPHKFLGGPGSSGIVIFCQKLYNNKIPDHPGGGTVDWTNPWGEHKYHDEIEAREDGGTPSFLQTIKVAYCIQLKELMSVDKILEREHFMLEKIWKAFDKLPNVHVLAPNLKKRLGVISFYIDELHYNLGVRILSDKFGIQVRGGCSCAGTYGHYLLEVSYEKSKTLTSEISKGILTNKPGWIRMSIHPTMTDEELDFILDGISQLSLHHKEWSKDYMYCAESNDFKHMMDKQFENKLVEDWFAEDVLQENMLVS